MTWAGQVTQLTNQLPSVQLSASATVPCPGASRKAGEPLSFGQMRLKGGKSVEKGRLDTGQGIEARVPAQPEDAPLAPQSTLHEMCMVQHNLPAMVETWT